MQLPVVASGHSVQTQLQGFHGSVRGGQHHWYYGHTNTDQVQSFKTQSLLITMYLLVSFSLKKECFTDRNTQQYTKIYICSCIQHACILKFPSTQIIIKIHKYMYQLHKWRMTTKTTDWKPSENRILNNQLSLSFTTATAYSNQ